MLTAVLGFAVVAGLLTLVPGIDTALVLRASVTQGTRAAYATVLGICAGLLAWGVAAAVGIAAILTASQLAYELLRLAGAGYLIFLGIKLIVQARKPRVTTTSGVTSGGDSTLTCFRRGLLTNLLNPKIGVFYMAVLPQFMPAELAPLSAGLMLAMVHVVESLVWFSLLIWGTSLMRTWLERPNVQKWIDRVTGGVLIGFGIKVAASRA